MRGVHTSVHHLVNAFAVNGEETGVTAAGKCQLSEQWGQSTGRVGAKL